MNKDKKFQELALDGKGRTLKEHLEHFKKCFKEVYGDMKISPSDVRESDGFALIPGKIKGKNDKEYIALIDTDVSSSGEHWGGLFIHPEKGFINIDRKEMKEKLSKKEIDNLTPYKYHLYVDVIGDIHKTFQY